MIMSYDECLPIMEEKNKIDELMFRGESLLGIQNQVDDLVSAEVVLEIRFDDISIQATTVMTSNEAVEEEDNVDADFKWIEQSIYDDDDGEKPKEEDEDMDEDFNKG
jgi:hypothetical protein